MAFSMIAPLLFETSIVLFQSFGIHNIYNLFYNLMITSAPKA
ncbi:hypothetical protein M988_1621 [Hafnia paralvei ATCC 29927]|nr:hypothetical protein M988_1621 [Hafnia paralvei ATCC 29927]